MARCWMVLFAAVLVCTPIFAGEGKVAAAITGGRTVFQRMEPDAKVTLVVTNSLDQALRTVRVSVTLEGVPAPIETSMEDIPGPGSARVEIPVDTGLKPGQYAITARFAGLADDQMVRFETKGKLTIVARPLPMEFPVVLWGSADIQNLKEIGFTHSHYWLADHEPVWIAGEPVIPYRSGDHLATSLAALDNALAAGIRHIASVRPGVEAIPEVVWSYTNGQWEKHEGPELKERRAKYSRIDRDGKPYDRVNVCALFPEIPVFSYNVGVSIGQTFGRHPALDAAMINTEVRDSSNLCFHPHDIEAYRAYSGRDIPSEATSRNGITARQRAEIVPAGGIIADDHPILDYYRWFWTVGDGWNELHTQLHRGFKTGTHDKFWTFFDPAVRVPPIWGSGGEVDVISQWTYTYPDPPKIGLATDELFAMAEGRPGQRVMKMTQIIWYRNQTAPDLPEKEEDRADWEKAEPKAEYITIAPDHLREAFWLKLSRPVHGIMYHGTGSLFGGESHAYRPTNQETRVVLAELIHNVIQPLGPTLMQIPDAPTEIAMLESFTSTIFGATGTWGWGRGWVADMHQVLQWARLQPRIVYEETILRDGLDGISVLVMPNCPVLTQSVYERIAEFQRRGGVIVGDQHLAPALVPDIMIRQPRTESTPDAHKAAMQALAAQLRTDLEAVHTWQVDSSDAEVIVRRRQYGQAEYLFAVNDKRTYGDYVGQHGRVMEKGLPHQATLTVRRPGATVYDLLEGRAIQTQETSDGLQWESSFGPGDGRLYMIVPQPIAAVRVDIAERPPADRAVRVRVNVVDPSGRTLAAVVPVQVEVVDPTGATAEFSGHYGARDGVVDLHLDLAANDRAGDWAVRCRELASGRTAEARFRYEP